MSTADRILAHLRRLARRDEMLPTAPEIADALDLSPSTVSAALRRMEADGLVRKAGEAYNGARTWTHTDQQ